MSCNICECKDFSCSKWKPNQCKQCFHPKDDHAVSDAAPPAAAAPAIPVTTPAVPEAFPKPKTPAMKPASPALKPLPPADIKKTPKQTPAAAPAKAPQTKPATPNLKGVPAPKTKHVKCLYDYTATATDQLSFAQDNVLTLRKQEGDWWEVEDAQKRVGLVPSNFVELVKEEEQQSAVKVSCSYPYSATGPDQLSFNMGDVLTVIVKNESGWWECEDAQGKRGLAPENFLKVLDAAVPAAAAAVSAQVYVKTLYEYKATSPDQLSFAEKEFLLLLERTDAWWQAKHPITEKKGLVPSNFVQVATVAEAQAWLDSKKKPAPTPAPVPAAQSTPAPAAATVTGGMSDADFNKRVHEEVAKERKRIEDDAAQKVAEIQRQLDESRDKLTKSIADRQIMEDELKRLKVGGAAAVAAPSLSVATAVPKAEVKAQAMFPFDTNVPGQLAFGQAAVLTILSQNGDWWEAKDSMGKTGLVPSNFVKVVEADGLTRAAAPSTAQLMAKGMYDFTPSMGMESSQVPFKAGEMLVILSQNGDWWQARNTHGQTGDVPSNFLQLVPDGSGAVSTAAIKPTPVAPAQTKPVYAKAQFQFDALSADQLSFRQEEVLTVLSREGEWWEAKNQYGRTGKIPHNYVQVVPEGSVPTQAQEPSFKYMEMASFEAFALFDYTSTERDHLHFNKLDTLNVVGRLHDSAEWWVAEKGGKRGIVPSNFLVKIIGMCSGTFDFNAPDANTQISFRVGDRIKIIRRDDSGWWEGVHTTTGARGLYPSNYTQSC